MSAALKLVVSSRILLGANERVCAWMQERGAGTVYHPRSQCIGYLRDGKLIAGVMYEGWNNATIWMHVAGEGKNWLNKEFLKVAFDYPFRQLGAKVIVGLVASTNLEAQKFDEHVGFTKLAVIPDGHRSGDLWIYTLRREDCRWLRRL